MEYLLEATIQNDRDVPVAARLMLISHGLPVCGIIVPPARVSVAGPDEIIPGKAIWSFATTGPIACASRDDVFVMPPFLRAEYTWHVPEPPK